MLPTVLSVNLLVLRGLAHQLQHAQTALEGSDVVFPFLQIQGWMSAGTEMKALFIA